MLLNHQELYWQSKDNLKIFGQIWHPKNETKAVFCLVHGMGEHSGRYQNLIDFLLSQNITVFAFDHRGHGKSEGKNGHTPSYDYLLDDIDLFLNQVKAKFTNIPLILYGHSLGGNLVLNFVLRRKPDLAGFIASAPWIKLGFEPPKMQLLLGKIVNRIYPSLQQPTHLKVEAISRDLDAVNAYKADKWVHGQITPRFFLSCFEAAAYLLKEKFHFEIPLLLYHGTADQLTSCEGSRLFYEQNKNKPITFQLWEGGFHEAHNDLHKEELFELLKSWFSKLLK